MPPLAAVQPYPQIPESTMQPQTRPPLRRATYIHVSDLTSAYNIDHVKLEQELARVLTDRSAASTSPDDESNIFLRRRSSATDSATVISLPQKRLQPPRGGFNLCVLVGKVNIVVNKLRVDQSRVRLAEVEVGDETGTVSLRARDDQIDVLQEVSERSGAVVLRNCTLELYQGRHIRLAVTKWGKLCTYPDQVASTPAPPSKMNRDRNFSSIDLSLVASDLVDQPSSEMGFPQTRQKTPERESDRAQSKSMSSRQQQLQSSHQHQHQHSRKGGGGRERKQQRQQKSGGITQLPMGYQDTGVGRTMTGFSGMQFSPSYAEALEVPHYPYSSPTHRPRPQESGHSQASSQQLLLHQYELQQRQMQQQMQMYQEQQERHRRMLSGPQRHQMQPSPVLLPGMVSSGSFDHSGDYPSPLTGGTDQHPSVMSVVGTNQLLIPMSVATSSPMPGLAPGSSLGTSGQPRQETWGEVAGSRVGVTGQQPTEDTDQPQENAWMGDAPSFQPRADSPGSPGRMNPQATAFAPSYIQSQGASQSHQMQSPAYTYALYDPSQTTPGTMYASQSQQHHSMYPQGVLYVPAVHPVTGASPSAMSSEQDSGGMEFQPIESPTGEGETPNRAPGAHERESESTSDQDNSGN